MSDERSMDGDDRLTEEPGPRRRPAQVRQNARAATHADAQPKDAMDERGPGHMDEAENGFEERDETSADQLTEEEAVALFLDSLQQSVLPELPRIPGYHTIWLTTNNPRDSIAWRERIGYRPITREETRGKFVGDANTGDASGLLRINEMVGYKIALPLYNRYMREVHHRLPLGEEEKLRSRAEDMKTKAESLGARLVEGDGTANVVQRARPMQEFAY